MGYKRITPKHPGANSSNMTMVGIGVDDPKTNLDVLGDVRIRDSQGLFFNRHGDNYAWRIRNESSADSTTHGFDGSNDLVFEVVSNSGVITGSGSPPPSATSHNIYTSSENTLVLKETGHVGIGVAVPLAKLHIVDGNNNAQIGDLNGSSTMALQLADSSASPIQLEAHGTSLRINTSTTSGATPTVKMIVLANGNVGIGTTTNQAVSRLRVVGATNDSTKYSLEVCNNSSNTKFIVRNDGETSFYDSSNALSFRVRHNGTKYTQMYNSTTSEEFNSSGHSSMLTTRFAMTMYGNQAYVLTFAGIGNGMAHVRLMGSHWTQTYGTTRESYIYCDSYAGINEINQFNHTSGTQGAWSISRAAGTPGPLTLTKSQGSYVGTMVSFIEITSPWNLTLTSIT